jgi:hypothetical protein
MAKLCLWIDAVCIDQAHTNPALIERDHQLQLMGAIYERAEQTLVWLGKDRDDAGYCLDTIKQAFEVVPSPK